MGLAIDRPNGQNYSDNVVDELLAFNRSQTWTVSSGTGSATIDNSVIFNGSGSLQMFNSDPENDLVVTNSAQSTIIPQEDDYGFCLYLYKVEPLEFMTLEVKVFKDAVLFNTQTFVLGSEDADEDLDVKWVRFDSFVDYNFNANEEITFTFNLKGKAGTSLLNTFIWIDGIMLYNKRRLNVMPPAYVPPIYNRTIQTADVVVEDLTAQQYKLSALNTAPSSATDTGFLGEIRITSTHIYVCTAEDVWVRSNLETW